MPLRVPHAEPVHPVPPSIQFTPAFCESLVTVALNAWVPISACTLTFELAGEDIARETAGVTVMVALAVLVLSVTEAAVRVTVAGGVLGGAI